MKNLSDKNAMLLEKIISSTFDAFVILDKDGIIKFVNPAAEKLFEKQKQELLGQLFGFPISGIDQGEIEIILKDRKYAVGAIRIAGIEWEGETSYLTSIRDITEHKQAEEKIQQQNVFLNKVMDSLTHPFYVIDAHDYKIIMANSASGLDSAIMKTTCHSITHNCDEPCQSQEHPCPLGIVKKTKKPTMVEHIHFDKDGNARNVEVHGYPIFDEKGNVIQMIEYCLDITERKQAVEALKDSEIRYHNLFENSSEFLFTLDLKGNFTDVNKAAEILTGHTKSELLKMNFKDYSPKIDHRRIFRSLYNIYKTGKPLYNFPIEAIIKDKSIKYFETSFNLLRKGEQIIGYQGSSKDITERKKAEEQIKKDLKEKKVLLQEIHHRVKNNMQIISSLLRLQSRYIKDEKALELFQNSQNRVRSMSLIHEALYQSEDLAHINFADYVKRLTTQLLSSLAIYTSLINLQINIKDIALDINLAIPCGLIINELVTNSLKYAFPEGRKGELSISFTFKDQTYILTVKDNGVGISEEIDLKNPQTLGLLLVNSLTKQLRGTLELEKTKGTCFKITFQKVELKTYGKV